jgi:hypothetical protein
MVEGLHRSNRLLLFGLGDFTFDVGHGQSLNQRLSIFEWIRGRDRWDQSMSIRESSYIPKCTITDKETDGK